MIYTSSFLLAFCWGFFIFLSFFGWGSLIKKGLFPKQEIGWAEKASWGMAAGILIGGILNGFAIVSKSTLICYLFLGILFFLFFDSYQTRKSLNYLPRVISAYWRQDKIILFLLFFIGTILLFYYIQSIAWINFNIEDDFKAYLAFPKKMLEQGGMGADPFSERRIFALGGYSFLQTLILSFLPFNSIHLIDPGLSYILITGLIGDFAKKLDIPISSTLFIIIIFLFMPLPGFFINASAFFIGIVFILAIFCMYESKPADNLGINTSRIFIISLLLSALCACKSNFIVFALIYLPLSYFLRFLFLPAKKYIIFECLSIFGLTFLFLLPWMIASYKASGTFLYPVLGRGFHASAYGFSEFPSITFHEITVLFIKNLKNVFNIFFVLLFFLIFKKKSKAYFIQSLIICINAFLVINSIYLLTPKDYYAHYYFYVFCPSLLALLLYASSKDTQLNKFFLNTSICFFLAAILFVPPDAMINKLFIEYPRNLTEIIKNGQKHLNPYNQQVDYIKAQNAVPEGEALISNTAFNFLLNFKRNKILIVDYLALGPKPGLLPLEGGEAIAKYFISKNIRYVIFSLDSEWLNNFVWHNPSYKLNINQWRNNQKILISSFQNDLVELSKNRKQLYTNGNIFVLDLSLKS